MATSEKNSELGNSLLLDDDEVSGYIFSHDKAAESNNLVEQSYSVQVGGTQFSILDMDLCGDSILLPSLPPHHIPPIGGSHKSDIDSFFQAVETIRLSQNNFSIVVNQKMETLLDMQVKSKDELKESISKLSEAMSTLVNEKQLELVQVVRNHIEYLQNQVTSTINWRVKHLHSEVLKDINAVMTPVGQTVHHLETKISALIKQVDKSILEVQSMKTQSLPATFFGDASVQTTFPPPMDFIQSGATLNPHRLQSTLQNVAERDLMSPNDPFLHEDTKTRSLGKRPIKLEFPFFGRMEDTVDPLLYLEKCNDYLALQPLTQEELFVTLRNVLHGTARDWWDVARLEITTWDEFEQKFRTAFLSEDYEDELAERIRTRVQGEEESIRDFAYMYRSLCKRWKPDIEEEEIIKMVLKNINPRLASQLRSSSVGTVDGLVRLGQQLEKDRVNQRNYEQRRDLEKKSQPKTQHTSIGYHNPSQPSASNSAAPVLCWRCKRAHSPATCPLIVSANKNRSNNKAPHSSSGHNYQKRPEHPTVSTLTHSSSSKGENSKKKFNPGFSSLNMTIPQQLIVPISIGKWKGGAFIDTGSSYTLLNDNLWKKLKAPTDKLNHWTEGPLYLADGGARQPLGWTEVEIILHTRPCTLPVVVLSSQTLAFSAVIGLDFLFFSGIQLDVMNQMYWFQDEKEKHVFQKEHQGWTMESQVALFSAIAPCPIETLDLEESVKSFDPIIHDVNLTECEKQHLFAQIDAHSDVCTTKLGCTNVLTHKIFLTQEMPIKQKSYRVSLSKRSIMKEHISEMLENKIIEPSSSAWAAPVVMIPKKTGGLRFCVDYRKLNSVSQTDAYPLPTIQEILESLAGAAVFSTLDLNSGYWQVLMDEESKDKTAFVCPLGLFQFNVMPFGLKNAPATFQRLMERVLGELRGTICFVYLDDIIIYSPTIERHFQDVQAVLDKLRGANLTVNMQKSHFFCISLKFLGHVVSPAGVEADPEKIKAVQEFPTPKSLKELQRFLGMAGWYHRFVPNFSLLTEPLNALKRKGSKFVWSEKCQESFEVLKKHLVSPPILGHPKLNLPFTVYTDASDVGLGAVLVQQVGFGEEVLAFASRSLNKAERNYSTTEKECLAVVWAIEKWRYYLEGRHFTVVTDHSSLVWVFRTQKPSTRLIRWALRLQEFSFAVEYRKGKYNTVPDALSRAPVENPGFPLPICATMLSNRNDISQILQISDEEIWRAQQCDPEIQSLYMTIMDTGQPIVVNATTTFTVLEDKVYRVQKLPYKTIYQIYIPNSLRPKLLQNFHEDPLAGHLGRFKMYKRLQTLVYWPKMNSDVVDCVRCCQQCQLYKPEGRKLAGKLQQTEVHRPWEMLGVDIMGPFPRSSNRNVYLLVFVDYYTRWVELFPLRQATAETIVRVMTKDIFTRWGVPDYILSNQGSQFVSALFEETCKKWNVFPKRTTTYHPQTNMTERINRTLKGNDFHVHWQ